MQQEDRPHESASAREHQGFRYRRQNICLDHKRRYCRVRARETRERSSAARPSSIPMHRIITFAILSTRRQEEIIRITGKDPVLITIENCPVPYWSGFGHFSIGRSTRKAITTTGVAQRQTRFWVVRGQVNTNGAVGNSLLVRGPYGATHRRRDQAPGGASTDMSAIARDDRQVANAVTSLRADVARDIITHVWAGYARKRPWPACDRPRAARHAPKPPCHDWPAGRRAPPISRVRG